MQGLKKLIFMLFVCGILGAASLSPSQPLLTGQNRLLTDEPAVEIVKGLQGTIDKEREQAGTSPDKVQGTVGTKREQADTPTDEEYDIIENLAYGSGGQSEERLNVLLLGLDDRGKEAGRSDAIMLVSINLQDNSAVVLSVLRDTFVTIPTPKLQKNRINAAYALGGPLLTVKTVSNFLQLPIEYYVVVNFEGFEKVVDAIGGVELDVEKRMDYVDDGKNDIHLKPGKQILNGHQALGYARFRHDAAGDFSRVERQKRLIKAVVDKVQGFQAVYYLPKILEAVKPYIKTNLDLSGFASLALHGYRINDLITSTIPSPVSHSEQNINGMAVLVPNLEKTRREVKELLEGGNK